MINKKSLWFLTLFSLILVLSIYYITMPSELLLTTNTKIKENKKNTEATATVKESDALDALRAKSDEAMMKEEEELQTILTKSDSTVDEKNKAYEKIKELNSTRGEEEKIEKIIKDEYKVKSFVKIEGNNIKVVVESKEHSLNQANNIMRSIQQNYEEQKFITVSFKNS